MKKTSNEDLVIRYFEQNRESMISCKEVMQALRLSNSEAGRVLKTLWEDGILTRKKKSQYYLYKLHPKHEMKKNVQIPILSDTERLALNMVLNSNVGSVLGPAIKSLKSKFEDAGLLTVCSESLACMDSSNRQRFLNPDSECNIDTLLSAVESRNVIEINYNAPNKPEAETIKLYPLGLFLRDENLYLYAYCPDKGKATDFSYTRISYIDYQDEFFVKPDDCMSLREYISDPFGVKMDPPDKVVVRVIDTQAYYEYEKNWPEGTEKEMLEDGSVRLTFQVCDSWQFMRWVLAMGSYAIIEEPYDYQKWAYWEHRSGAEPYEKMYGRAKLEEPN